MTTADRESRIDTREKGIEITPEMVDAGVNRAMDFEEEYRDSEECVIEIYKAMVHARRHSCRRDES